MSFNFNGPSFKPMIQESQMMKNNGGGGNTGYFQRGKKKKKDEKIDIFADKKETDSFSAENEIDIPPPAKEKILDKIIEKTKKAVKSVQKEPQKTNNPFEQMSED